MLAREKIEHYKNVLEKERGRLLKEIGEESRPVDFGNDVDSLEEEADESEEFQNQMAIAQGLKDRVNEIDLALSKIEEGTYGKCEKCGAEISEKILKVAPESILCEYCKKQSQ